MRVSCRLRFCLKTVPNLEGFERFFVCHSDCDKTVPKTEATLRQIPWVSICSFGHELPCRLGGSYSNSAEPFVDGLLGGLTGDFGLALEAIKHEKTLRSALEKSLFDLDTLADSKSRLYVQGEALLVYLREKFGKSRVENLMEEEQSSK